MSAFIVEDRTINKIIAFLGNRTDTRYASPDWHPAAEPFTKLAYDLTFGSFCLEDEAVREAARRKLAADLYALNCRAYTARYGEDEEGFDEFAYRDVDPPSPLEFIKLCACLCYQCDEGDAHETPLYQALDETVKIAAVVYVASLPEYDALDCWE